MNIVLYICIRSTRTDDRSGIHRGPTEVCVCTGPLTVGLQGGGRALYIAQTSERGRARKARANARERLCAGVVNQEGCAAPRGGKGVGGKKGVVAGRIRGEERGSECACKRHISQRMELQRGRASERAADQRHGTQHIAHTDHINQRLLRAFLIIRQPLTIPRF